MATISRMAINLAWEGQEAEAGLAKTSSLLKQTGIAALDTANNFNQIIRSKVEQLGLDNNQIRSLTKLSELDQERALARMEEEENLRSMSKSSQLLYEQMKAQAEEQAAAEEKARRKAEARAEMLAGMTALEKEQLFAREKERQMLLSMTAEQQKAFEANRLNDEQVRSAAKSRADMLAKMTLLEKDALFAKEKERALLMTMSPEQQKAYEQNKANAEKLKSEAEQRQKLLESMSALDRRRFLEKEAREKAILGMTEKQQLAFEKAEKAKLDAQQRADRLAKMSFMERVKDMLKGMNDIKATIEMIRGMMNLAFAIPKAAFSGFSGLLKLGGELETAQIKMGALVGDFDKGAASLENLRQITRDMGVPLQELVGGFQELVTAGVNAQDAEKLLRSFSKLAPLLGQGGLGQVASGIGAMAQSGMAERSALDAMQKGGIQVYEALAEKLTRITGEFYSVRDAQKAVEQGAVLASTAIQAAQQAASSPKALEAAQRISNSLEGQLARLKEGFTELLRDVGDGLLRGLDVQAFIASLRGVFEAIQLIVRSIVDEFLPVINPADRGKALEDTFKRVRDLALDAAEKFAKMAVDLKAAFDSLFARIQAEINKLMARLEFGPVGLIGGGAEGAINRALDGEDKLAKARVKAAEMAAEKNKEAITKFFDEARKKAEGLDANRANDKAQLPANAGPQLPNTLAATDQFTNLRNLKLRAGQPGAVFNPGEIQSALSGFMQKQADAGINQRIEAGTSAAVEAIIRNNQGDSAKNIQEEIKAAIEAANQEARQQTELEKQMLDALKNIQIPPQRTIQLAK